jgi:hypothetical protein
MADCTLGSPLNAEASINNLIFPYPLIIESTCGANWVEVVSFQFLWCRNPQYVVRNNEIPKA